MSLALRRFLVKLNNEPALLGRRRYLFANLTRATGGKPLDAKKSLTCRTRDPNRSSFHFFLKVINDRWCLLWRTLYNKDRWGMLKCWIRSRLLIVIVFSWIEFSKSACEVGKYIVITGKLCLLPSQGFTVICVIFSGVDVLKSSEIVLRQWLWNLA